jgi:hypothetical protein
MELYHGGLKPVAQPRIIVPPDFRTTDFGPGFYTTNNYEQARKWGLIRRSRNQTGGGFVSVFESPEDLVQNADLKRLVFPSADKFWLVNQVLFHTEKSLRKLVFVRSDPI